MRTLQAANAEYFQKCALLGEKVAQISALKEESNELAVKIRQLFDEIQIHKAAQQAPPQAPPPVAPPPSSDDIESIPSGPVPVGNA